MKKIIAAILCIVALIMPFAFMGIAAAEIPAQYDESFLGELSVKHRRLCELDGPKLVLIGGSNLAFGVDSALLGEYTGMPVVNYGLYAAIGTKAMLDLSRPYIGKGDIVVVCPETDAQTYSLYYNGKNMWQALDSDLSMLGDVGFLNWGKLIATLPGFVGEKYDLLRSGVKPSPQGIYSKASFNELGDIAVDRPYNEMPLNYDTSMPVNISAEIIADDFLDYLNDYASCVEGRGAKLWFSFSPMNSAAVVSTDEQKDEFYRYLGENLDFPIISGIDDYILDPAYFYDTNFHLNSRGALLRTALLADDILRALGVTEYVETVKYTAPKRPENYFSKDIADDDNSVYFTYVKTDGGLSISGLSELGLSQKVLTVPKSSDNTAVLSIMENAFAKSEVLEALIIPADTSLKSIENRAFAGCASLKRVEISADPANLAAGADAFTGMASSCKVYVPEDLFGSFATDYFWSGLMKYIERQ